MLKKICASVLISSSVYAATEMEELKERMTKIEKNQEEIVLQLNEPKPQVSSFLNNSLTLGGYFEPGYTVITGDDTDAQSGTSNILAINIASDYQNNFHFSAQTLSLLGVALQNPHNDPRIDSDTFSRRREFKSPTFATALVQGYLEYSESRNFNVQAGLGYVPFGYAFQERELILFLRRGGPQMLRYGGTIVSPLWEGVNIHGTKRLDGKLTGYNVYTFSSPDQVNKLGVGGRFWMANTNEKIKGGLSFQSAKGDHETTETFGADIKYEEGIFLIRSEFFQSLREDQDPYSIYLIPSIKLYDEKIVLYVFGDYLFNPDNKTNNTLKDPIQRWEYGGGINWLPTTFTRYRFGVTYNDYVGKNSKVEGQERDYWSFDISAGVAF